MSVCPYSCLSYPALKLHLVCDVLSVTCGRSAPTILFDITWYNATAFGPKKSWFHLPPSSRKFLTLKTNTARYYHKCTNVFMWSTRCNYQILVELWIFSKVFFLEKFSNIKFLANPSSGSRVFQYRRTDGRKRGQTDRQTDRHKTNSHCSQFFERAR